MRAGPSYPEETPAHTVAVDGFWLDPFAVTDADFAAFVVATGYVTRAGGLVVAARCCLTSSAKGNPR